jgi:tripartite ATP-independent transporter DctM subunit
MVVPPTRNSTDVFHILNARRGQPVSAAPQIKPGVQSAEENQWTLANLWGGIKHARFWLGRVARAVVLDRSAYQEVVLDSRMTGPALLIGLAMATIAAIAVWSAISGSATATAATIGTIVLPEMKRRGYNDALRTACVAAGSTMDILIPPSSVLVLYGILTEQSIGKLLIAGTLPGLLIAALFAGVIYIWVKRDPKAAPVEPAAPFRQKVRALKPVWTIVVIFILVMGGIYRGFFTPTEAAAVGAFISLIVSVVSRRFSLRTLLEALDSGARTTAMLFIILIGAIVFSRFLAVTRIPHDLSSYIAALNVSPYVVIAIIIVVMVFLGCFIEGISLMMLTVPIMYPLVIKLGFDGVWFGILLAILLNIGMCTPPVGMSVYVVAGVAKDVPLMTIFRGVVPFWLAMVFGAVLLVIFPQIALWLPRTMR